MNPPLPAVIAARFSNAVVTATEAPFGTVIKPVPMGANCLAKVLAHAIHGAFVSVTTTPLARLVTTGANRTLRSSGAPAPMKRNCSVKSRLDPQCGEDAPGCVASDACHWGMLMKKSPH